MPNNILEILAAFTKALAAFNFLKTLKDDPNIQKALDDIEALLKLLGIDVDL